MNQSPVHNVPEDPIQKEIDKLDETNKKQEGRVRNLETKAIQLVNLYFVFQGMILTSASTSSSLNCHKWWIPLVLSLLAALMNLFAFISAISKVLESREELDQCFADLALMSSYRMTRAQVNRVLPGTPFNQPQGREIVRPKPRSVTRWNRRVLAYTSIGVFIGFSAVIMYGCYTILCSSREGKCVKVC